MASSDDEQKVLPFLQSRVAPSRSRDARALGVTPLARQLGLPTDHLTGHWCSRCVGIWFGTALEVECPSCGSRQG
jgi:hypothetical protein